MHIQTSDQARLALGFGGYTCNWGTHMCGLYEADQERDEIIFGFLHQGDLQGDFQLYCLSEGSAEEFKARYASFYPECAGHPDDPSRFEHQEARALYYPDGLFSPWQMDEGLSRFFCQSQQNGPRHIRATADMVWALSAIPGVEHLMAYESRLNYFIPGKPWISICLYDVRRFSGATVMNVLRTHPYVISQGVISRNPYFQNPTEWLRRNAPEFLSKGTARGPDE